MTREEKAIALEILGNEGFVFIEGEDNYKEDIIKAMHAYHERLSTPPKEDSKEPVFSLQEALDIWETAENYGMFVAENNCQYDHSKKGTYFKTKFNITL